MEKLKKVNSFSELKAGQIVVIKNCRVCHKGMCRKILTKIKSANIYYDKVEDAEVTDTWFGLPNCSNININGLQPGCTYRTIAEGRLFLVEDGLEDMETVENRKVLEKVK
jgi:hypothetical protein